MTWHRITTLTVCSILLGTACDLGDKSIGNETGADQGEMGETGDGDGDGDTDGDGDCGEQTVSIIDDLDAELPSFAATANDYIALAEGSYLGSFTWPANEGPVTVEHAETMSPLTVTVAYEGGEIRLTEVELVGEFPMGDGPVLCGNQLEIDVTLMFETEDGLFDESFAVPLRANSHSEGGQPNFDISLDFESFNGSLALDDFAFQDAEITDLVLHGQFDGDLVQGGLSMEVLTMDWVGFGGVASFEAARP